ncbi:hypothetical protein DPMN_129781 [Dreissena polymorpha]|uniref:Uncharacterized protein n=1 Tax=Dreissena polymorpha TaxID=45954 RepID=A0A9D4K1A6_DREPO|nr:hypothetical protein DPMN_129781 [Dreissena polymorpha]
MIEMPCNFLIFAQEPTRSDILWEQAVADPEKFEFFTLVEKECGRWRTYRINFYHYVAIFKLTCLKGSPSVSSLIVNVILALTSSTSWPSDI